MFKVFSAFSVSLSLSGFLHEPRAKLVPSNVLKKETTVAEARKGSNSGITYPYSTEITRERKVFAIRSKIQIEKQTRYLYTRKEFQKTVLGDHTIYTAMTRYLNDFCKHNKSKTREAKTP